MESWHRVKPPRRQERQGGREWSVWQAGCSKLHGAIGSVQLVSVGVTTFKAYFEGKLGERNLGELGVLAVQYTSCDCGGAGRAAAIRRYVALDGAAVIEELEEIAFVRLFPLDAVGRVGAEVQAFDVGAEQEAFDEVRILGEGGNDQGLADVGKHLGLRNLDDAGVGKHELGIRERMIAVSARDERRA